MHAINTYTSTHSFCLNCCTVARSVQCALLLQRQCANEITLKSQLIAKLFEHDYKTFYVDILIKVLDLNFTERQKVICYTYIGVHEMPEINESHHTIDTIHDQTTVDAYFVNHYMVIGTLKSRNPQVVWSGAYLLSSLHDSRKKRILCIWWIANKIWNPMILLWI